ncbi:hypothetical protein ACFV0Z_18335 [Streptomyces xiamenensis]|uniref:hypothetical protein n=1 Tax=Streptomyces xiamenensis TaxID=408015 RepID=UPI00367F3094
MSIVRPAGLALCTLSMTLAVLAPAGAAFAAGGGGEGERERGHGEVRISPAAPRPGEEVVLRVTGCRGKSGTAHSEAFVAEAVLAPSTEGGLFGEARVSSTVAAGTYRVDVSCDGEDRAVTGELTVAGSGGGGHDKERGHEREDEREQGREHERERDHEQEAAPSLPSRPSAPVRAGGGGTATAVAGEQDRVPTAPTALTVLSGVLAAVAALTVRRLRARER